MRTTQLSGKKTLSPQTGSDLSALVKFRCCREQVACALPETRVTVAPQFVSHDYIINSTNG